MTDTPKLIGLAGYARSGKDTLAKPLIERGFVNLAFSSVIKEFFDPFTRGVWDTGYTIDKMRELNSDLTWDECERFEVQELIPYANLDVDIPAFTEENPEKGFIRPVLERGGELIYDYVLEEYFRRVDAAWSAGKSIVNTRIVKLPEIEQWKKRGGLIFVADRTNWPAATSWEEENLKIVMNSGFVDDILFNDRGAAEWEEKAKRFAEVVFGG